MRGPDVDPAMRLATTATVLVLLSSMAVADDAVPSSPTAATRRLLRELASGRRSIESMIDPEAGLVYIDYAGGEAGQPRVERRLCAAADRRRKLRWILRAMPGWLDDEDGGVACRNRPGPPSCTREGQGEFDPTVTLTFEADPVRGLRLRHVVAVDWGGVSSQAIFDRDLRRIARAHARLAAATCPAPEQAVPVSATDQEDPIGHAAGSQ